MPIDLSQAWTLMASFPGGHNPTYAVFAAHAGRAWFLGGYAFGGGGNQTLTSSLDPATGEWRAETPLTTPASPGPGVTAVVNNVAYLLSEDGFWAFDLDTGAQTTLTSPTDPLYGCGLHHHDGRLYWMGPTPQAFDLTAGTWAPLAAPPAAISEEYPSCIDPTTGLIYVVGSGWFASFDPTANTWQALPAPTHEGYWAVAVFSNARVILFAGRSSGTLIDVVQVFDVGAGVWSIGPTLPFNGSVGGGLVNLGSREAVAIVTSGGDAYALIEPVISEAELEIVVSVELPVVTTDAHLTIQVDVTGGVGAHADLLVSFSTGRVSSASVAVVVDVVSAVASEALPVPNAPAGNPSVVQPGTLTPRVLSEICEADEYQMAWGFGGQLVGSTTILGQATAPGPEAGFNVEPAGAALSREWQSRDVITTTLEYQPNTVNLANDTVLPELMPLATIEATPGLSVGGCLKPHAAVLCEADDLMTRCAITELLPSVLPTRRELAEAALAQAGISLFIVNGVAGLPLLDAVVDVDYRTEGKSPVQVVSEMLLTAGAPHWYAPSCLFVHGGGLQSAAFVVPNDCTSGRITTQAANAGGDAEPLLAAYLADCLGTDVDPADPCNGETFETAASGTLTWTENAGAGLTYQEVQTTLTKERGRIVREEIITRRAIWTLATSPTSQFTGGGEIVIAPVEWTVRDHTYLACCPSALAHSLERTWVTRFNADPNADYESASGVYLSAYKEVTQTWHAEGWLRSRLEATYQQHGWRYGLTGSGVTAEFTVIPTYKANSRSETYVPIGKGMWHINTRISDSLLLAVDDAATATNEVVGSLWGEVVNTYTVVTDAAPAQVTCDDGTTDPCDSGAPCAAVRTAAWQRDHDNWVAVEAARAVNDPPEKLVMNVEYEGRRLDLRPGVVLDGWIVASVSWSGSGPRVSDQPSETTSVEFWAVPA